MAKNMPLITIGITCYNAQDTIESAINSALKQDWDNKEILVVDDCSRDNSCAVIEELGNVRLIKHKENTGPGGARQTLLKEAKGEFLAFFDDDDISHPERLTKQYERIVECEKETGSTFIACYASGQRLYPNGYQIDLPAIGRKTIAPHGEHMAERILYFAPEKEGWNYGGTPSCAVMARTDTFRQVGGFDPAFRRVEDLDFAVRLALAGGHFVGCTQNLFTQHATEGSDKSHEKNLEAELQLAKKHEDFLKNRKRFYYAMTWPTLRYYHFKKDYPRFIWTFIKLLAHHPLQVCGHILKTGPKRLAHEAKMRRKKAA